MWVWIRQRAAGWHRDERGLSLPELMVATFVFGIVMLIFTSTMASVQRAVVHQENLSQTNDQARLALQQLDREIRSGNVLYDPADEDPPYDPYYTVRVYTQSNAPTRGEFTCVLWTIDDEGQLLSRSWPQGDVGAATEWRVVATGIVNKQLDPPVGAFALDADPLKGERTLDVTLMVNEDLGRFPNATFELQQSLTGRNTSYGYPVSVCATTPE
jgi:prepilin-type N-terminal cleavage/methylation domain-containing protein